MCDHTNTVYIHQQSKTGSASGNTEHTNIEQPHQRHSALWWTLHPRSQQAFAKGSLSLRMKFLTGKHSRFAVLSITHSLSLESDGLFGSLMVLRSEQVAICEGSLVIRSILSKTDTPCQSPSITNPLSRMAQRLSAYAITVKCAHLRCWKYSSPIKATACAWSSWQI